MKPMKIEAIQITQLGWPITVAIPPMVNSTPAGTPLEAQKASFQSSWRRSSSCAAAALGSA
jgi:hypothetical protein